MKKIKFFLGLWSSKLLLFIYKLRGRQRDDRPGLLAYKFCDDFIKHVAKPKIMIGVTGTNGKSTITSIVNDFLTRQGLKVAYNDWFANELAGHARCLLDAVTIFNKPRVDVAILEIDENTIPETLPYVSLDYLIVTNLSCDSLKRNAYISYIASKLKQGFDASKNTKLIINADDPICSFIEHDNETIYYAIEKTKDGFTSHNVNDFPVCPKCHSKITYLYQHYRHIGKVKCDKCGFKSIEADYIGSSIDYDKNTFIIKHNNKKEEYPIISKSLFNVFNELSVICLLKDMGYTDEVIRDSLGEIKMPPARENYKKVDNIEINLQVSKGQNGSSSSTIFEHISKMDGNIEIVLLLNDMHDFDNKGETVTWIYETDFFFLNKPNIKRIIVGDYLAEDYKTAMLLNGIDESKIFIAKDSYDTVNYVTFDDIDKIMILFDVSFITGSRKIRDEIIKKMESEKKNED